MIRKWYFYTTIVFTVLVLSSGFKPYEFQYLEWFHVDETEELFYTVPTSEESAYQHIAVPFTGKTFAGFKQALAFKESQGKYHKVNPFGYMGKYQFGMGTLRTIGITDSLAFMRSPRIQEQAFKALLSLNKWELRNEIQQYEGKVISGVTITESGLLAAAHLGGVGSVRKFLRSNGNRGFKDGFGTSLKSYIKNYGGYDTSIIQPQKKVRVKIKQV
ncbi:peptidoglycan-binding protein LysM [Flavobacterium orientale]|uniref:Peptidoglycan-binding protein LysM n=1 Tax=Flavobacterium orientale TaxID=1756020 RepID=A0A916Y3M6_9FLAO|nr:peptidoglycan-binding protein LysM [Flavobacterium orientale]GGD29986.1 peptidoglycan-binding protein LysM [Flavobacterium orientale]